VGGGRGDGEEGMERAGGVVRMMVGDVEIRNDGDGILKVCVIRCPGVSKKNEGNAF